MTVSKERTLFEKYVSDRWFGEPLPRDNELVKFILRRKTGVGYESLETRQAWKAWLARSEVR